MTTQCRSKTYYILGLVLSILTTLSGCAQQSNSAEIGKLDTAWERATISLPSHVVKPNGCRGWVALPHVQDCLKAAETSAPVPVVLYMHGCDGPNGDHVNLFQKLGYAVVAPNSGAIPGREIDCSIGADKKDILRLRLTEVDYTLTRLRGFSWANPQKIILAGFSEGGVTSALHPGDGFAGRIILGWTCTSLDPWWDGIRAPKTQPILAIVGSADQYYQNDSNRGDCGPFTRPGSQSIIIDGAPHSIISYPQAKEAIEEFLTGLNSRQ